MTATMPKADVAESDPLFVASGATDTELQEAIDGVNDALAAKQDESTAATDAELANAVANLITLIAAKQDALTAATDQDVIDAIAAHAAGDASDAELQAAVDALTAAIATKQDAATAATDIELAQAAARSRIGLAATPDALLVGTITRDANGAVTAADVVWPDGADGTFTGTPSTAFPGAIDAYVLTYEGSPTITYTQPAMTRNADGAVIARPALVVT